MHGDFSRWNDDPTKRYTSVLEQQGRVRLDSDFNEYVSISRRLRRTLTRDMVGSTAIPHDNAGFEITASVDTDDDGNAQPKLSASSGRMYVEGVLCELAETLDLDSQKGVTGILALPSQASDGDERIDLTYVDVWDRHVTATEDPNLRDVALGGPDTTTRLQTITQLRVITDVSKAFDKCQGNVPDSVVSRSGGLLSTTVDMAQAPDDPCIVASGGGYRGLENRLYRIEIHQEGNLSEGSEATFKWSRDNGAIVYSITAFKSATQFEVNQLGLDEVMALQEGDWIEVLGDETELAGKSGTLVQIDSINESTRLITLNAGSDISVHASESSPKIRRWDGVGSEDGLKVSTVQIELEDGIKASFALDGSGKGFRTGDYWMFAARSVTNDIERLKDEPPFGIEHSYAPVAMVRWRFENSNWVVSSTDTIDLRKPFAALADQQQLLPVGGDGQDGLPGSELCAPLEVRTINGSEPVPNARVIFEITEPTSGGLDGVLISGSNEKSKLILITDSDGYASCKWRLSREQSVQPKFPCRQVTASLVDCDDQPLGPIIHFNARVRVAALYYVGGDGQEASEQEVLCSPLEVRLASGIDPISRQAVRFRIVQGTSGRLIGKRPDGTEFEDTEVDIATDEDGLASCRWRLEDDPQCQKVEAFAPDFENLPIHFTAKLESQSEDQGIHIKGVQLSDGAFLLNDSSIRFEDLLQGLRIAFDGIVDPNSIKRPTCYVTVEDPFIDLRYFDNDITCYVPTVLKSRLKVSENVVFWSPHPNVKNLLKAWEDLLANRESEGPLLARLTLTGNFIWAPAGDQGDKKLYLDGETFGETADDGTTDPFGDPRTRLVFPTGDRRQGGDFTMWFWLDPKIQRNPNRRTGLRFDPDRVEFTFRRPGTPQTNRLEITNPGDDPVTFSFESTDSAFSVSPSQLTIEPNDSEVVKVIFKPTERRPYSGEIRLMGDNVSESIGVTGTMQRIG